MHGDKVTASLLAPGPVQSDIFREDAGADAAQFVGAMRAMLDEHGVGPDEFAVRVFEAIDRGEYWIIPQPETFDDGFRARNAAIEARRPPQAFLVEQER